jgi:hypothetical protein
MIVNNTYTRLQTMENPKEVEKKKMIAMFDMVENPIMYYIADFLEETPSVIFHEHITDFVNPIVIPPIDDYKKNIYLKLTLKSVKYNEDYQQPDTKNLLKYVNVREAIGFMRYAIGVVYSSIIANSMINNKPMLNTTLKLDEEKLVFYPTYQHDNTISSIHINNQLSKIVELKRNIDNYSISDQENINREYSSLMNKASKIKITPEIKNIEQKFNDIYENKPRLAIIVEELTKEDLPKPEKNKNTLSNLNSISTTKYVDPH